MQTRGFQGTENAESVSTVKVYVVLKGRSGAVYVFNVGSRRAISDSLRFYKTLTMKQKAKKAALYGYLYLLGLLRSVRGVPAVQSREAVASLFSDIAGSTVALGLDEDCSALISPTRDKIIVNHHGRFFQKLAFGNSYAKASNEANVYALLRQPFMFFRVSDIYDFTVDPAGICAFKLGRNAQADTANTDIIPALAELFNVTRTDASPLGIYLDWLAFRCAMSGMANGRVRRALDALSDAYGDAPVPLGLVHRDFKPWNVNDENGLLFYDFEETVTDGLPLEDLLNYVVDPIVRNGSAASVYKTVFMPENVARYNRYLLALGLDTPFEPLLLIYVLERALFWREAGETSTSEKYLLVLEFLTERGTGA